MVQHINLQIYNKRSCHAYKNVLQYAQELTRCREDANSFRLMRVWFTTEGTDDWPSAEIVSISRVEPFV